MFQVFRYPAAALLSFGLTLFATSWHPPEEGMYPMSELERIDLASKGIGLTAKELFNPDGISLVDGICRVNGCTGSFVSSSGLIITNHHCAYEAIQKASTPQRDLLANGFQAKTLAEEIPAPDYQIRVTEDYRDVSEQVLAAVDEAMSFSDRTRAIEKRSRELEQQAERDHPGLRAEVAEMFAGKTYVLFLYTWLKDVRLVFAPPASVGNFGGEVDNWEWPRHTGDFSFMRAYTAPDGSSATWASDNIPYKPKRFVQVAPEGVDEGDAVFLLGYPGRTARHKTASFLQYEQNVRLPMIVDLYQWQIAVMTETGASDRQVEIQHASRMRSLANVEKRSRGQLKGLVGADIVRTRQNQEAQLQEFIAADPQRREKYGQLLDEIAAVYAELTTAAPLEINLQQLTSASQAASNAFFLVDSASEREKPDLERESQYTDRNFEQSVQRLKTGLSDFHAPTDATMLAGILRRLSEVPAAAELAGLKNLLADPSGLATAAKEMIAATELGDPDFVAAGLGKSPDELRQIDDPLLQLVIGLYPKYIEIREANKSRDGRLSQLYGSLIEVKQQHLATSFVPDANATLRFTCGRVRAYSPEDAVIKTPITTLTGVINKTTGVEPFVTPDAVLEKYRAGEFGQFRNAQLGDVPVAILYDTDTTGGNSGSPIFNGKGHLVGVNFDRCFEATINDFAWDQSYSRSIGVDIRYVLWITGTVYGANHLLEEMGIEGSGEQP